MTLDSHNEHQPCPRCKNDMRIFKPSDMNTEVFICLDAECELYMTAMTLYDFPIHNIMVEMSFSL